MSVSSFLSFSGPYAPLSSAVPSSPAAVPWLWLLSVQPLSMCFRTLLSDLLPSSVLLSLPLLLLPDRMQTCCCPLQGSRIVQQSRWISCVCSFCIHSLAHSFILHPPKFIIILFSQFLNDTPHIFLTDRNFFFNPLRQLRNMGNNADHPVFSGELLETGNCLF